MFVLFTVRPLTVKYGSFAERTNLEGVGAIRRRRRHAAREKHTRVLREARTYRGYSALNGLIVNDFW